MELRQLEYFLAVAESGRFTQAAEAVHVSQPALSQQIKKLEAELGTPLFDRLGRGTELTEAGELLLPRARRILSEVENAEGALGELQGIERGSVTVGTVQTTGEYLIPRVVSQFHEAHPNVDISVKERSAPEITEELAEGALDLGVGFLSSVHGEISADLLFEEALVAVVPPDHPWTEVEKLPASRLSSQPLVLLPDGFCTRNLVNSVFDAAGIDPMVRIEMNSIAGILATVRAAGLATILPALTLSMSGTDELEARQITDPRPSREVALLFHSGRHRSAATEAFAEYVHSAAETHVADL
jgi:LysR family cyn operon transcriptional activator